MSPNTKRWLVSSLVTFAAGFIAAALPVLDSLDIQNIQVSAIVGILLVGVRAGVKALAEAFLAWYASR